MKEKKERANAGLLVKWSTLFSFSQKSHYLLVQEKYHNKGVSIIDPTSSFDNRSQVWVFFCISQCSVVTILISRKYQNLLDSEMSVRKWNFQHLILTLVSFITFGCLCSLFSVLSFSCNEEKSWCCLQRSRSCCSWRDSLSCARTQRTKP